MASNIPPVLRKTIDIDGIEIFCREAGPKGAPVVLLPHGYPCSSFRFRNLVPEIAALTRDFLGRVHG